MHTKSHTAPRRPAAATLPARLTAVFMAVAMMLAAPFVSTAKNKAEEADSLIRLGEADVSKEHFADAIQHFMGAQQIAQSEHLPDLLYLATYDMGICYFYISEFGEALNCYYAAHDICVKHKMSQQRLDQVQAGIAGVYFEENNFDKAAEILDKCYRQALHAKDSISIASYASNLALISNKKKEWAKALQYIGQAERWIDPRDTLSLSSARTIRTETYMMQHRYDKVTVLADSILKCQNVHNNDRTTVLIYLIEIFTERGEYAKALAYANEALATASARNKPWLYDKLAIIYQRQGRHQLALQMKDSVIYYKDSLSLLHDHQLSENERIREDVIQLRSDMERNETYLRQHRYIIGLLICVILLIALIAYQRTRILRSKNQQDKRLMEMEMEHQRQERLLMERQMKEAELTALHEQEVARHKQQITELSLEQKKRELSATTLFVSSRNALIEDLLKSLAEVAKTSSSPKLNELMLHLKHMLQDHEKSNDFLINFESANPDFIRRIKERHPDLTTSDLRFLAFLRMNLSTKEIASFMGITPDSCKRRKIRLSQKLQLPTSSDLSAYVMQF